MYCEIDMNNHLPVYKIWGLNGRYYGALAGLKKMDDVKEPGIEVVQAWWVWWMCLWMQLYNLHNTYSISVFLLCTTQTCVIHWRHVHYPWIKMIPTIPWMIDSVKIYPGNKFPSLTHWVTLWNGVGYCQCCGCIVVFLTIQTIRVGLWEYCSRKGIKEGKTVLVLVHMNGLGGIMQVIDSKSNELDVALDGITYIWNRMNKMNWVELIINNYGELDLNFS